jgi:hypothetical protein
VRCDADVCLRHIVGRAGNDLGEDAMGLALANGGDSWHSESEHAL